MVRFHQVPGATPIMQWTRVGLVGFYASRKLVFDPAGALYWVLEMNSWPITLDSFTTTQSGSHNVLVKFTALGAIE